MVLFMQLVDFYNIFSTLNECDNWKLLLLKYSFSKKDILYSTREIFLSSNKEL